MLYCAPHLCPLLPGPTSLSKSQLTVSFPWASGPLGSPHCGGPGRLQLGSAALFLMYEVVFTLLLSQAMSF